MTDRDLQKGSVRQKLLLCLLFQNTKKYKITQMQNHKITLTQKHKYTSDVQKGSVIEKPLLCLFFFLLTVDDCCPAKYGLFCVCSRATTKIVAKILSLLLLPS